MAVTVVVRSTRSEPPRLTFDSPRVVIGRSDSCEVRLPDPSVSHRHASIRQRGVDYLIQDEGSTNGTFVGPVRLPVGAPRVLKTGDRVRVGRVWLEIRIEPAAVTQNQTLATKELALRLVAEGLAGQGEPAALTVEVRDGPSQGRKLELLEADRPYVVGRGKRVDLSLEDPDLSRQHLQIVRKGDRVFVRDLASKNGSHLDDDPVPRDRDARWARGRNLRVGQHQLAFEDPVGDALAELDKTPDEKLSGDERLDEPDDASESPSTGEAESQEPEQSPTGAPSSRPPPDASPRSERASTRRTRSEGQRVGWTATDYLVTLAALVVLTLSILGIWWLLGMGS